ncbi:Translation elongation factor P Lys34:lysine transferase [invertebrate metagenome]|uniref:Translation elongation factor P Lys34:lysine transferase n=1 Tax=invertebrate metagenome TaxID=1711999 RepID=A0A484H5Y4_9ZZZZ
MTWWTPERFAARRGFLEQRTAIVTAIRAFFSRRGFLEVETPVLQVSPGLDPHIAVFATELIEPFAQDKRPLYLHTSPEFAMKKLLAAKLPRIFQIARVYRNGERSPLHHPEFTLLEWYRAESNYLFLMDDCENLLREVILHSNYSTFQWMGRQCDPHQPWERLSVADAFTELATIDLLATLTDPLDPDPTPLAAAAHLTLHPAERWEDVFFRIMLERIEPHLGYGKPLILYDYPTPLASLASSKTDDKRLAERFEVYVCGVELANGYSELTDVAVQRARFRRDTAVRKQLYGTALPVDEDFLNALTHMPPAAGIALGLDRLIMLAVWADDIQDVLWAPVAMAT